MTPQDTYTRRGFLGAAAAVGGGLLLGAQTHPARAAAAAMQPVPRQQVSPAEDLMSEHGVLERLLLVYDASASQFDAGQALPADSIRETGELIRSFIEDYHEKLEEQHVFPLFEKAGREVQLVEVLRAQHQAGRTVTDEIRELLRDDPLRLSEEIAQSMRAFVRMYRPHAAREDTVLFRVLREVMSPQAYLEMGETFEQTEDKLFGEGGFGKILERVVSIEKAMGINDLAQFTPVV